MKFTKRDEEVRYSGHFLKVVGVSYESSDGDIVEREYIKHPGAVTVVPVARSMDVFALWQFRAAIGSDIFEVCAGKRDVEGEDPAVTAERELEEELGIRAKKLVFLASFFNSPGFCDEETRVYLALGLSSAERSPQSIEEKSMRVAAMKLGDVHNLISGGVLKDAKSIVSLMIVKDFLASDEGARIHEEFSSEDDLQSNYEREDLSHSGG